MSYQHDRVAVALADCGGSAYAAEIAALGISRNELAAAVRSAVVVRAARGVYALPTATAAEVHARVLRASLTCLSAVEHYKLWSINPAEEPHVVARHRRVPSSAVDHRYAELRPCPVAGFPRKPVQTDGGIYAPVHEVVAHALRCLPFMEALVIAESAANKGLVDPALLGAQLHGNRNGRARAVLAAIEPNSDSLLETIARVLFRRAGFATETQVNLEWIGRVDFLLEGWLIIEIDGMSHLERAQFKKDRRRDNASVREGYVVLRFFYEDVIFYPADMVADIRRVLAMRAKLHHFGAERT